jgi:hypothetical protein
VPTQFNTLWMAVVMLIFLAITSLRPGAHLGRALSAGAAAPLLFYPAMFPGIWLAMRRARLSQELLLPLSREQFIDGVFWQLVRDSLNTLVVIVTVALVAVLCLPADYPETTKLVAGATLLGAVQPYMFGVATYSALRPSAIARFAIMMAAMTPAFAVCIGGIASLQLSGPWPALFIAAAVLPIGIVVVRKSRQAWLNAELA